MANSWPVEMTFGAKIAGCPLLLPCQALRDSKVDSSSVSACCWVLGWQEDKREIVHAKGKRILFVANVFAAIHREFSS
jgi:hypothetical protein